jgi:hypothetical protein
MPTRAPHNRVSHRGVYAPMCLEGRRQVDSGSEGYMSQVRVRHTCAEPYILAGVEVEDVPVYRNMSRMSMSSRAFNRFLLASLSNLMRLESHAKDASDSLEGGGGGDHVPSRRVHHPLGLAGRPGSVLPKATSRHCMTMSARLLPQSSESFSKGEPLRMAVVICICVCICVCMWLTRMKSGSSLSITSTGHVSDTPFIASCQ